MLNKIKTLVAVAVLSGTVSANVQAATVTVEKGDTLWNLSRVHNTSVENIQKLNHLTTDLIHPGLNLLIFDGIDTYSTETVKQVQPAEPPASVTNPAPAKVEAAPQPALQTPPAQVQQTQPAATAPSAPAATSSKSPREITVKATAYTASCDGCSGITATGINIKANPNIKVIAVDPSVIPLGTKVYVEGVGEATAADTGGAIKGNRIDVFIPSQQDAINFGVKQLKVTILN